MVVWVVNTCHSVALRDCLGRKNALYKYLILYFYFTSQTHRPRYLRHLQQQAISHALRASDTAQ